MVDNKKFILIEGDDDQMFFERVIRPRKPEEFRDINYFDYAQKSPEWIGNRISKLESGMPKNVDYIFLTDKDDANEISDRKEKISQKYDDINKNKIHVVEMEIESWFFAGLKQEDCKGLKIPYFENTDDKDKYYFMNNLRDELHRNNNFRTGFLINITTKFSIGEAKECNSSFKRFCECFDI